MQRLASIVLMVAFGCATLFAQTTNRLAPGAPGKDAHWPSAAKQGFGTANDIRSKVWFTLADGVMTEVYYPTIDVPNVQMLQLLIVDSGVATEIEDTTHRVETPARLWRWASLAGLDCRRAVRVRRQSCAKNPSSGSYWRRHRQDTFAYETPASLKKGAPTAAGAHQVNRWLPRSGNQTSAVNVVLDHAER